METFSALLAICAGNSPAPGEFPAQRPVTRSFDVSFDLRLNKRLSKQWWGWWFETLSRPLWRHRNENWEKYMKWTRHEPIIHLQRNKTRPKDVHILWYIIHMNVSKHRKVGCLFKHLFRLTIQNSSKHHIKWSLTHCEDNSPVTDKSLSQRARNAGSASISWHHHRKSYFRLVQANAMIKMMTMTSKEPAAAPPMITSVMTTLHGYCKIYTVADFHIDGLVQERRNSIANALELRLSCTNPSMWYRITDILLAINCDAYVNTCRVLWYRADAMEIPQSCTKPSICTIAWYCYTETKMSFWRNILVTVSTGEWHFDTGENLTKTTFPFQCRYGAHFIRASLANDSHAGSLIKMTPIRNMCATQQTFQLPKDSYRRKFRTWFICERRVRIITATTPKSCWFMVNENLFEIEIFSFK